MKHSSMSDYDVDVIPMVEYFNSVGLKTYMSCSGHKDNPYMSMFWIEFDPSVTEHGETISKYNSTLLTPLKSNCILESLRGSLMYDDDGCPNSFSSKCFFNLFNYFFDKEYGHCVPFPEIKFYLVS